MYGIGRVSDSGPTATHGPPHGGPWRVRPKALERHVAELDVLVSLDIDAIVAGSYVAVGTQLHNARAEVKLNVARSSAVPIQAD
jgi:hypothetical protein